MHLIAGLGNPGRQYAGTRHNVGFEVVEAVAVRHGLTWESAPADALMARWRAAQVILVKPLTFMNLSGHAVGDLLRYFKVDPGQLLVVVDDADLPVGRLRARARGSAGGHNGLKSIIGQLGSTEFSRLRVGVGRDGGRKTLAGHVLATFAADERPAIGEAVARAADAVELFVAEGIGPVMNRFNADQEREPRGNDTEQGTAGTHGPRSTQGKEDGD